MKTEVRQLRETSVKAPLPAAVAGNGYEVGEIKWFGGFNAKIGVENAYGFISTSKGDVYFHRSQTLSSPESLIAGAQVIFLPSTDRMGKVAASSVRVLLEMSDTELVGLIKETKDLSAEVGVTIASVRDVIAPCENEVLRAVSLVSGFVPLPRILEQFWDKFPPSRPQDPFFGLAPRSVKSKICRHHYSPLLNRLRNLFKSVNNATSSLAADAVYIELAADDRRLADYWANGQNEAVLAKMLSARAAEKAARKFYEGVGQTVQDVSITQLDGGAKNWTTHDLLLNSSNPIDVKNARRPIHSKRFYVEHTVPRFKLDRRGANVRVAAILSPYLNLRYINDPGSARFKIDDLIYLGETSRDDIYCLMAKFRSDNFEVTRTDERTFPHWAFGYPDFWYRELLTEIGQTTKDCEWPDGDLWKYILDTPEPFSPVPALCVMGQQLPAAISSQLSDWQVDFYSMLQRVVGCPPSLPAVFFAVLTDFLVALRADRADFTPQGYLPLLYSPDCIHPLGAIDPLNLVRTLVTTLTTLWIHREKSNLERFSSFRFGGLGILQGREHENHEWTTIVAYCGGTVYELDESGTVILTPDGQPQYQKGRCGHTPVVIGTNRSCHSCRKLICDKCGFCSAPCREQSFRALADQAKRKPIHLEGRLGSIPSAVGHEMPDWELVPLEAYEDEFRRG